MGDWIPEVIVGIDFGMTCTGLDSPPTLSLSSTARSKLNGFDNTQVSPIPPHRNGMLQKPSNTGHLE